MALYIGYYYGAFIDSSDILTAEEIDCFYNGEEIEIIDDLEKKGVKLVTSENEPMFILGKQVNSDSFYDVYYSGQFKKFDLNKFIDFDKSLATKEAISQLNDLNEVLQKYNRPTITLTDKELYFFSHTIS